MALLLRRLNSMRHPTLTALLVLCMPLLPLAADEAVKVDAMVDEAVRPGIVRRTHSVLVIKRGDDVVEYEVTTYKESVPRKKEIVAEAKAELAAWEESKARFFQDRTNRGKEFLSEKPDPVSVTIKDFTSREQADSYVSEKQSEIRWVVARVKSIEGSVALEIMRQDEVKKRSKEMQAEYKKAAPAWEKAKNDWYANPNTRRGFQNPVTGEWIYTDIKPFQQPQPVKPEIRVLARNLPSEEEAQAERAKLEASN